MTGKIYRLSVAVWALMAVMSEPMPNVSAADILYVTMSDDTIVKYDTVGNSLGVFANTGLSDPRGLAFDSAGNLYVANYISNSLSKFDSQGNYLPAESIAMGLNFSLGVAVDASGFIYVSNESSARLRKFDAAGNLLATSVTGNTPTALAFDNAGTLRVANRTGNTIASYDTNLNLLSGTISTELNRPRGLAIDTSGNIYAANAFTDDISKFSGSGSYLGRIGNSTNMNNPYGLAFDSEGYLYVANELSRTIAKFSPTGSFVTSWATGAVSPRFIAFHFTPVPEPGTMALGAIAMVAAVLAKRRSRIQSR
jgi:DNA-binding beta-propeller fold protein YncE